MRMGWGGGGNSQLGFSWFLREGHFQPHPSSPAPAPSRSPSPKPHLVMVQMMVVT